MNYYEDVKDSMVDFINDYPWKDLVAEGYGYDDIREKLYDDAWVDDCVTGNASGSYTCSSYRAEENLVGNWDLLAEALEEFGEDHTEVFRKGAEWCDVTIRCYILGQVIDEAMEECGIQQYIDEYEEVEDGEDICSVY